MMNEDVSAWKTKAQSSALVGISEKAIERAGNRAVRPIRHAWRKEPGKKPYLVYHPEDLAKLRSSIPQQVTGEVVKTTPAGAMLAKAVQSNKLVIQLAPPPRPRPFVTIPEMRDETGLSRTLIERAIRDDKSPLPAFKDGGKWKIARTDMERFVEQLAGNLTASRQHTRTAGQ